MLIISGGTLKRVPIFLKNGTLGRYHTMKLAGKSGCLILTLKPNSDQRVAARPFVLKYRRPALATVEPYAH